MSECSKYHTGMAAEFHVLSMLHRLGVDAHLTLGNNKAVDIIVKKDNGLLVTIDVKGLLKKGSFPVDNYIRNENHFVVFVCFLDKCGDHNAVPGVFIVPSNDMEKKQPALKDTLVYHGPQGQKRVQYANLERTANKYQNNWEAICKKL